MKNLCKRGLSLLIVLVMCMGMLHLTAFANDDTSWVDENPLADAAAGIVDSAAQEGMDSYHPEQFDGPYDGKGEGEAEKAAHGALNDYLQEADGVFDKKADGLDSKLDQGAGNAYPGFTSAEQAAKSINDAKDQVGGYLLDEDEDGTKTSEEGKAVEDALGALQGLEQDSAGIEADMTSFNEDVAGLIEDVKSMGEETEDLNDFLDKTYEDVDAALTNANDTFTELQERLKDVDGMTEAERAALREELRIDDLQKQVSESAASVAAAEQGYQDAQARVAELEALLEKLNQQLGVQDEDGIRQDGKYQSIEEALSEWNRLLGELTAAQENLNTAKTALTNAQNAQAAANSYLETIQGVLKGLSEKAGSGQSARDVLATELERLINELEKAITDEAQAELADRLQASLRQQKQDALDGYAGLETDAESARDGILTAKGNLEAAEAVSGMDKDVFDKAAEYLEMLDEDLQDLKDTVANVQDAIQNAVPGVEIPDTVLTKLAALKFTENMTQKDKENAIWDAAGWWGYLNISNCSEIVAAVQAANDAQATLDSFDDPEVQAALGTIEGLLSEGKTLEELKTAHANLDAYEQQLKQAIAAWNTLFAGKTGYDIPENSASSAITTELFAGLFNKLDGEKTAAGDEFDARIAAQNAWLGDYTQATEKAAKALSDYLGEQGAMDIQKLIEAEAALRATQQRDGDGLMIDKQGILEAALEQVIAQIKRAEGAKTAVDEALAALQKAQNDVENAGLALKALENSVDQDNLAEAQRLQEKLAAAQAKLAEKIGDYNQAVEDQNSANSALESAVGLLNSIQIIAEAQGGGSVTDPTGGDSSTTPAGGGDSDDDGSGSAPSTTPVTTPGTNPGANPGGSPMTDAPAANAPGTDAPEADAPVVDIPDAETPMADVPDEAAPVVDIPDAEAPEAAAPVVDIPDADVPLANAPAVTAPETGVPGEDESLVDIADGEVPLAGAANEEAPVGGNSVLLWAGLGVILCAGVSAGLVLKNKKRED